MYFKPKAKPTLPRYADTIEDVAGYVHDDGTIQPDILETACYFDEKSHLRRYSVILTDEQIAMHFGESLNKNDSYRFAQKTCVKFGERIRWQQLPPEVQKAVRIHVTPLDMLIDTGWRTITYQVAKHFVPALINCDITGLNDEDESQLAYFGKCIGENMKALNATIWHWACDDCDDTNFALCEISDLMDDCTILTLNYKVTS